MRPDVPAELIAPVAQMRQAIIYQRFLDGIEECERVYHRADVPERLGVASRHAQSDAVPPMADLSELVHVDEERVDALFMSARFGAPARARPRLLRRRLAIRAGGLSTRRSGR